MITIKIEPWKVVKAVYDMCHPVGMGFLQYVPGEMTQQEAEGYVSHFLKSDLGYISMDYVGGRQCKFHFKVTPEGCEIDNTHWYDHHPEELAELVAQLESLQSANG